MKKDLMYLYGDLLRKGLVIITTVILASAYSCMSLRPIDINQESKYTILANVSNNSLNHLHYNYNFTENTSNVTTNTSSNKKHSTDLWSWGKIPMGYELNKNGTLTKQANGEWKPSI